jgi:hypothetical protein
MDYFIAGGEVNSFVEIDMACELFCLPQCGGQVGHLDKAIAHGHMPETVEDLDQLETIGRTHARYILKLDRESDQSLV